MKEIDKGVADFTQIAIWSNILLKNAPSNKETFSTQVTLLTTGAITILDNFGVKHQLL